LPAALVDFSRGAAVAGDSVPSSHTYSGEMYESPSETRDIRLPAAGRSAAMRTARRSRRQTAQRGEVRRRDSRVRDSLSPGGHAMSPHGTS